MGLSRLMTITACVWISAAVAAEASDASGGRGALAAFEVYERKIEIAAVTRRARADTTLRRQFLEESEELAKVYPGYPQQPFVSFDVRVRF